MGSKPKHKMPVSERAKQFAPFSSLTDLGAALAQKERRQEQRRELSEESAETLDEALRALKKGDTVTAVWYDTDAYRQLTGTVTNLDPVTHRLTLGETVILFDDLAAVLPLEE